MPNHSTSNPPPPRFEARVRLDDACEADPFSPQMRYPSDHPRPEQRKQLTPLGVLVEIDAWEKRYPNSIREVSERHPHDPFRLLMESVRACIARETGGSP